MRDFQLLFNSLPLFQVGKNRLSRFEEENGNFVEWRRGVTYWHDFHIFAILLHEAQQTKNRIIEVSKGWILEQVGNTKQGKNYNKVNESIRKWSGVRVFRNEKTYSLLSYEESDLGFSIEFGEAFYEDCLTSGKVYSLDSVLKSRALEFRVFQLIAPLLHYNKILRFDPMKMAEKLTILVKNVSSLKKRIGAIIASVVERLCSGWKVNQAWEWSKGKRWLLIYKQDLVNRLYEKQESQIGLKGTLSSPNIFSDYTNIPTKKQVKTGKEMGFEETFSRAASELGEYVVDFDASFLRKPEDKRKFITNYAFLIEVAKYDKTLLNGRTVYCWIQDGCPRSRFQPYLDHKANLEAAKQLEENKDLEKEKLYKKVAELLRLKSQEDKEKLWKYVCKSYINDSAYILAKKEFLHIAINETLADDRLAEYKKNSYLPIINMLFSNEFSAKIPESWYPYKTIVREENKKPKLPSVVKKLESMPSLTNEDIQRRKEEAKRRLEAASAARQQLESEGVA